MPCLKYGLIILSLCLSFPVWGAEKLLKLDDPSELRQEKLTLDDVLRRVLHQSISLKITRLQKENLKLDRLSIQEQMDNQASITSTLSDETKPTSNPFAPSGTNTALISASILQPLENGARVTLSASYVRSQTIYPSTVPIAFQPSINPTYQQQIDLIYRYPLMKGHDNLAYQATLKQNQANQDASRWQTMVEKEQLAAQVIQLFFQMQANRIAIDTSQDAVLRAKKLLAYQKKREHFGLIEKADRLQAQALLATREMERVNAQATWRNTQTSLNRLMYRPYQTPIQLKLNKQQLQAMPSMQVLQQRALQHRAVFKLLDAQEAAAHALLLAARENDQQQLDVIGQVGTRSLSGSPTTALGQGLTLNNRYLGVSLEWSDSLTPHDVKPSIQKAELALARIQLQRQQASENIKTEISQAMMQYENATMTLASAQKRVVMEKKKFVAEMQRYREGRSDTATLIQFEGALRFAELQSSLQGIQIQWALARMRLATGELL